MPYLLLIKHSLPEIDPARPARQWRLSDSGRLRCKPLAEEIRPYRPTVLISSVEAKAVETAQIVAAQLNRPFRSFGNLHEHERTGVNFVGQDVFESKVKELFQFPEKLVYGNETASQACDRFSDAIATLKSEFAEKTLAVVTHGTVISLFVVKAVGIQPFALWKRLGLPSLVVLSLPGLELIKIVERVEYT